MLVSKSVLMRAPCFTRDGQSTTKPKQKGHNRANHRQPAAADGDDATGAAPGNRHVN
jgi:hypothetical protein